MSSAMPSVDLALALYAAREQAQERSEQPGDDHDELAQAAGALRSVITSTNRTGGETSRQVERAVLDDHVAEQLRADLTALSHDRSPQRARALTDRLRQLHDEFG